MIDVLEGTVILAHKDERKIVAEVRTASSGLLSVEGEAEDFSAFRVGEELTISLTSLKGVREARAKVEEITNGRAVLQLISYEEIRQRRAYARAKIELPVAVLSTRRTFKDLALTEGVSVDISQGGLKAQFPGKLTSRDSVVIALELSGEVVFIQAKVLEADDQGCARFEFINLDEQTRERLSGRVLSATVSNPDSPRIER